MTILNVSTCGLEHGYAGRFGIEAIPDQQGVIRTLSAGKFALLTPVDSIVIQCALSQPFAGSVTLLIVEPAATKMVSPQAAALISVCNADVVESGPRTVPGEGVALTGVYMHFTGRFAGPSVVPPDHVPDEVQ